MDPTISHNEVDLLSRRDGISKEIENQLRIYGCEVIQEGGILLKLPQAVMATAQVLLQRFYVKESMLQFNIKVRCDLMVKAYQRVSKTKAFYGTPVMVVVGMVINKFMQSCFCSERTQHGHRAVEDSVSAGLKYSLSLQRVAWACCWLATKLEETPRRIRDVLSVFYRVDRRREGKSLQCLDIYGQVANASPPSSYLSLHTALHHWK